MLTTKIKREKMKGRILLNINTYIDKTIIMKYQVSFEQPRAFLINQGIVNNSSHSYTSYLSVT